MCSSSARKLLIFSIATDDFQLSSAKSTADLMNEELKMVLESFRRQRPHLDIVKTPDVYINQESTPEEVQSWLKMKGFSKRCVILADVLQFSYAPPL